MTYQWPQLPKRAQVASNKGAQCSYCKANDEFRKIVRNKKRRRRTRTAKDQSVKHTLHMKLKGKRITQQRAFGKALVPIYVPIGHDQMTKAMMPRVMKDHPRGPITHKRQRQATQLQKNLEKKFRHDSKNMTICRFDKKIISNPPICKVSQVNKDTTRYSVRCLEATEGEGLYQNQ